MTFIPVHSAVSTEDTAAPPSQAAAGNPRLTHALGSWHLMGAISLAMLVFSLFISPYFLLGALACLGWLAGVTFMRFRLTQARARLEGANASIRNADQSSCGIRELDNIITFHNRKVVSLMEVIRSVQGQFEDILGRYETLSANIAAAVIVRDARDRITFCSPFTEVLTGYSLNEIFGREDDFFLYIVHDADRDKYLRSFKISATGEPFQFRYRIYHKTGIELWVETRAVPILDENGDVVSTLSVTLDVTATVRYQRQIEEKNRDLQDFTYMVSHDLKAPICTIKGMLHLFEGEQHAKLTPDAEASLRHIHKATDTLERLVTGVLEYVRITNQDSTAEDVDLQQVFADILNDFSSQIRESGAKVTIAEGLPRITSDRLKLYQVFSNLIGNALKYGDPSRPVEINVGPHFTRSEYDFALAVQDNGVGIPSEKMDLIFRPFQRAHDRNIEGSGIGLACVKKLVDRLGGAVEVVSEPGKGSTFCVILHRVRQPDSSLPI